MVMLIPTAGLVGVPSAARALLGVEPGGVAVRGVDSSAGPLLQGTVVPTGGLVRDTAVPAAGLVEGTAVPAARVRTDVDVHDVVVMFAVDVPPPPRGAPV